MSVVRRMLRITNTIPTILRTLASCESRSLPLFLPKNVSAPPDTKPDKPLDLEELMRTHAIMMMSAKIRIPIPKYFKNTITLKPKP